MHSLTEQEVFKLARKMQGPYGLRKIISFGQRVLDDPGIESVAVHKHNLGMLVDFFVPIAPEFQQADIRRVHDLLRYHDLPEIHPDGDIPQTMKEDDEDLCDDQKLEWVLDQVPQHMHSFVREAILEFELAQTYEAKLAFAMDKLEPTFEIYVHGIQRLLPPYSRCIPKGGWHGWTAKSRRAATIQFPTLYRFGEVLGADIERQLEAHRPDWAAE